MEIDGETININKQYHPSRSKVQLNHYFDPLKDVNKQIENAREEARAGGDDQFGHLGRTIDIKV